MAILHVRNFPDQVYAELQQLALARNRSISAEAIILIQEALRREQLRQKQAQLLAEIRRRRFTYPKHKHVPDSIKLLREDRER